ncbi:MAG: hypothetical protein R3C14_43555 [Caldilineaceae bacterium]
MHQYFRPGGRFFAGDAMPFSHAGVFHLFYLLDEEHHQALGGLGGHQWAHATTTDLAEWVHQPLAIGITDASEGSICTGSVFFHDGVYYGFYATRNRDRTQHLSLATSHDGIHFTKQQPNPLAVPGPGYSPYHFRDPFVFRNEATGPFHMLVTAKLEPYPVTGYGGCLAHLVSSDLHQWEQVEPFVIPGHADVPECADLFAWNGWYYLIFSNSLVARYRMARHPLGPWQTPPVDILDGRLARVMKTAAFTGNRRLGVAWLGTREGNRDDGRLQWGGHLLFRELLQQEDGTLHIRFAPELALPTGPVLQHILTPLTGGVMAGDTALRLDGDQGLAVAMLTDIPQNVRITLTVEPTTGTGVYGLSLRSTADFADGYELLLDPIARMVRLHEEAIYAVEGLDRPLCLEIVFYEDMIDVCVDERRCIINRCPERRGDRLYLFAHNSAITVTDLQIRPIKQEMNA